MIQIKKGARRTVQPLGIMLLKGGTGWLQKMILLVAIIAYSVNMNGQALKFIGTTPENGSTIESLENIIFHFDLTDVINTYGEGEWGVCCNGFHFDMFPQREKNKAVNQENLSTIKKNLISLFSGIYQAARNII